MKVLLTALNAKYIHSSLALRYLQAFCNDLNCEIKIREFNINQHLHYILGEIAREDPDVIGFSCYIWNRTQTLDICRALKEIDPGLIIILGGPEVSFSTRRFLQENPYIDFVVRGEGEMTFRELLEVFMDTQLFDTQPFGRRKRAWDNYSNYNPDHWKKLEEIDGISYSRSGEVRVNPDRELIELDLIPSVYSLLGTEGLENKLVYLETSRGCPFNCQYCISSTTRGVRYFPMQRVKEELKCLVEAGIDVVKFVDRTFNCNQERALEVMDYIFRLNKEIGRKTVFHFEVKAEIISKEMLVFLKDVPRGLFQFEIGVQSTNPPTLKAINRSSDFEKLKKVVRTLKGYDNIHLHLDLIAGLPHESYARFAVSFNDVFDLKPHRLQLGFLKLLPGSDLRHRAEKYDYRYTPYPPYRVLSNASLDFKDILRLEIIEEMVETYFNSQGFCKSLKWLIRSFPSPFAFFESLGSYWLNKGYHHHAHKVKQLYAILNEFAAEVVNEQDRMVFRELLKYDYLCNRRSIQLPEFLNKLEVEAYKERFWDFIKDENKIKKYLPHYLNWNPRRIGRKIQIEPFPIDIENPGKSVRRGEELVHFYLFDYGKKDPVTSLATVKKIEEF